MAELLRHCETETFKQVSDYGQPYLDNLPEIQFDIDFRPLQPTLEMPVSFRIDRHYLYYDEEQNVWYRRFDGRGTVGPIQKIVDEKDYPMSLFLPL